MKIAYWIVTVLLCVFLLLGGYMDLSHKPQMVAAISSLGYPEYFLTIDGTAKLLAVLALLVPGFRILREWAYAGLTILTIGAAWSHMTRHQNPAAAIFTLGLTLVSYWLWRKTQLVSPKA